MPRLATKQPTARVTITTTCKVQEYLERLIPLGLYGNSVSEVAERLLCEALRDALKRKKVDLLETPQTANQI